MSPLILYQLVALALLVIGLYGLTTRKSFVGMLICVELMLNGAGLSITAAAQLTEANAVLGQLASLLVMGLAAAEATLVLAILIVVIRRFGPLGKADADTVSELRG
ncbi:NAD(P)H-quinone oxidoreductase subunit 4L [Alkalidesulfovibrio alkalitolerans DSM 16529]|uniref:NADH-quinone oxidoreductase subunit K n=1 Tax=Alkalidesulfovibrio alkalitolerans DSM 16529 TaxID=1121439 RepID=S7TF58_9BACT|nr:NADH-quinone oxidoreductase subunit NuoK [Alkalidesulfovibrio alkalitolerans]EPR35351.1 NAD(P)H-quinone oxidoreductase subunit 4L [Alkalidesulfovibrio alkalitolerans DSM 16529]